MISISVFAGWAFRVYNLKKHPLRLITTLMVFTTLITLSYIKISSNPKLLNRYLFTSKVIQKADLDEEGRSYSLRNRYALAKLAWHLTLKFPFGIGFDNFSKYSGGAFAHSNYFEILSDTGFPGFLLFYSIYIILFFKAFNLPANAFENVEARRLVLIFPLMLSVLDIGLVNFYSKNFWLSVSLILSVLYFAKQKDLELR
jgi:O-antigen ligase